MKAGPSVINISGGFFPRPGRKRWAGFTAQGINGQFLYVNPREKLVIVANNAWDRFWDDDLEREIYDIFSAIKAKLH